MNTISKMVSLAALCLMMTPTAKAQDNEHMQGKSAKALQEKWFTVDTNLMRYETRVELGKGEYMLMKFSVLSDWTSGEDFQSVFPVIDKVMKAYKDSLNNEQNTQVLDIYIPANQKNIITRFNQYNESGNMMAIGEDGASSLKLGMDTLRVIQAKSANVRIQYTFILKRLANYNTYAHDEHWKKMTVEVVEAAVTDHRMRWKKHPNALRHGLNITIDPEKNTKHVADTWRMSGGVLTVEAGLGVSLVRNMLCPNYDYGISANFPRTGSNMFVRLSASGFVRFVETTPDRYKAYSTNFVNLELGSESSHDNPKSLFYKTSVGFGYKLLAKHETDRDPTMDKQMYRFFLNYSVNRFISVTPEFITNFRKADNKNSWVGLAVNLHIL